MLPDCRADGGVRSVHSVVFPQRLQYLSGELFTDMLNAVLIVRVGDVQIAVEELLLVLSLHMHDLHVLNGAVVGFADVNAGHGVEKAVVALQRPLQKRP